MTLEAIEQVGVEVSPAPEVAIEPVSVAEPVVAEEPLTPAPIDVAEDVLTLDGLLEKHPELRSDYDERVARERQSAADRQEAKLRRDAGKRENVQAQVQRYLRDAVEKPLRDLGADEEVLSRFVHDPARLGFMYEIARENAATELVTELPNALLRNYQIPPEKQLAAIEARDQLITLADGSRHPNHDAYVMKLVDAAVEVGRDAIRREERAAARETLAAELKAAKLETTPKVVAPPAPPAGVSVGASGGRINTMNDVDAAYTRGELTGDQYRAYAKQFNVDLSR